MTSKAIKRNIDGLENRLSNNRNRLTIMTKGKIRDVIQLYKDRRISQYTTASNMINELIRAKTREDKERATTKYESMMERYEERAPLNERMKQSRRENIQAGERNKKRNYALELRFYTMNPNQSGGMKKSFYDSQRNPYYPMTKENVYAHIKATKYIEEQVRKRIFKNEDKRTFNKVIDLLIQDDEMNEYLNRREMRHYADAVVIYSADVVDGNPQDHNPRERNLRNADNIGIYHRYIQTELDTDYTTFEEAIKVKHYTKNECWINALNDFYGNEPRMKKMTRENVLRLIGKTDEDFKTNGASINDMEKVFIEYRISARIFDCLGNLYYRYDPSKPDTHIKSFYGMIKNDHIYTLNKDLKALKRNLGIDKEYKLNVKASSDFHINTRDEPIECRMIDGVNDFLKYTEKNEYTMIYNGNDLSKLYFESKQAGYNPCIKFTAGIISELNFRFRFRKEKKEIKYKVKTQNLTDAINGSITVEAEKTYNNMSRAMFEFSKRIFNPLHKSYYNEVDIEILNQCRTIPPAGKIHNFHYNREEHSEIDQNKAYTYNLGETVRIPVFNEFDVWEYYDYNKHDFNELGELCLFLVRVVDGNALMFFNKPYLLIYDLFLKEFADKVEILYFKRPSCVYDVDYKKCIRKLYDTKISDKIAEDMKAKKMIVNVNIGMLEKSTNKSQKSLDFESLTEAVYYQNLMGGRINKVSGFYEGEELVEMTDEYIKELEEEAGKEIKEWNEYTEDWGQYRFDGYTVGHYKIKDGKYYDVINVERETDKKYYTLTVGDKKEMANGFRYIKELVLQRHNFKMYQDYYKLMKNDVKVYSVKTDAFIIDKKDVKKARKLINFSKDIGGWRAENDKQVSPPSDFYKMKDNEIPTIPVYKNERLPTPDEYDTQSICENIVGCNPVFIKAKFAGSGKSYIGEYMKNLGYNVLFVVPNNKQLQEVKSEAITYNKFFSIPVEAGESLAYFDHSDFDCIVFDEMGQIGGYVLNKIRHFINTNSNDKIIIGTADGKQLKPIVDLTNTQDHEKYLNKCLNQIFKYKIYLKICKRVKTEEDRQKVSDVYDDIWKHKLPIDDVMRKHFEATTDIMESEHNIAYTNRMCKWVSNTIRKNLGKSDKYEVGDFVICRKHTWKDGITFNVNFKFEIKQIVGDDVVIENVKTKQQYPTDIETLDTNFIYAYCATCHSSQGASVDKTIAIHEWDKKQWVSREWIYTSITRATDLNKVKYFVRTDDDEDELTEEKLMRYFEKKISSYKVQDMKGNREIDESKYIDVQWLMDRTNSRCNRCSCEFEFNIDKGIVFSNMTAQRVENTYPHSKENCIIFCHKCNCRVK